MPAANYGSAAVSSLGIDPGAQAVSDEEEEKKKKLLTQMQKQYGEGPNSASVLALGIQNVLGR